LIVVDTNVLAYLLLPETKTNLAETLLLDPPAG
jgi:predicted nucleic acid-binding protein